MPSPTNSKTSSHSCRGSADSDAFYSVGGGMAPLHSASCCIAPSLAQPASPQENVLLLAPLLPRLAGVPTAPPRRSRRGRRPSGLTQSLSSCRLGRTSQGKTREETLSMIREAIELYIESLVAHGDPIPGPVETERVTVVA